MAQIRLFGADKIGTLSESSGTITMQPSVLTIGGQQYNETSALTVAANLDDANTRYQIYAVRNSGNTELMVSSNENNAGPSGEVIGSISSGISNTISFTSNNTITSTLRRLAQGFTTSGALSVRKIRLDGLANLTSSPITLAVEIYSDSAGQPGSILGTSNTVDASSLPTANPGGSLEFEFSSVVALSAGTDYHISLKAVSFPSGQLNWTYEFPSAYPGPEASLSNDSGSSWLTNADKDYGFEIFEAVFADISAWKLVGSYYTDGLSSIGFGSFVNIVGPPITNSFGYLPTIAGLGTGSSTNTSFLKRIGDSLELDIEIHKDGSGGTGSVLVSATLPSGLTVNADKTGDININHARGSASYQNSTTRAVGIAVAISTTTVGANIEDRNSFKGTDMGANTILTIRGVYPIVGWSNTPIEDL